ncbi:MAG: alpha/beta fold hydrolase [bacterium]
MPIVVSNRRRIFYRYEGEKGAYLLLHHGLLGSHLDWYDAGYVDALAENFRLILPDARGHGRSDHPLAPEDYRIEQFADDVIAIMEELQIRNLHFFGYSFGAMVGMELLLRHPDRVRITMMAGESPFVTEGLRAEWRETADRIRQEGLSAAMTWMHGERRIFSAMRKEEGEGEQQAALALLETLEALPVRENQERLSVNSPVALFIGAEDRAAGRVQEARKAIHRARFVSIPNQDHIGLFTERESLLAEVMRLARSGKKNENPAPRGKSGPRDGRNSGRRNYPATPPRSMPVPARDTDESGGATAAPGDRPSSPELESSPAKQETAPQETAPQETAPQETAPQETAPQETAPQETAQREENPPIAAPRHDPPEGHQSRGDLAEKSDSNPGDTAEAGPGGAAGHTREASLDTPGEDTRDASSDPEKGLDNGGPNPETGKE